MAAYYNENDPYAAAWLRNLAAAGIIPAGTVDSRSIHDVTAADLDGFAQCHFFAGIGGWAYALRLAGWPDDRPVWTGSCPCQPFSVAGRQEGFADPRHLWPEFRRLISERQPPVVFGEQVASATDWLRIVRSDLEALGYAMGAIPVEAASAGADHRRDRFWFVADAGSGGFWNGRCSSPVGATGTIPEEIWQQRLRADAGTDGGCGLVADPDQQCAGQERPERSGQLRRTGGHPQNSDVPVADPDCVGGQVDTDTGRSAYRSGQGQIPGPGGAHDGLMADPFSGCGDRRADLAQRGQKGGIVAGRPGARAERLGAVGDAGRARLPDAERQVAGSARRGEQGGATAEPSQAYRAPVWIVGADGKARRVEPTIRLLAHGVPARVPKLRAFGNAIDPRPASQWIAAYMDCRP